MNCMRNIARTLVVGCVALLSASCGDCEGRAKDADAFVENPANQACMTDADCVVVSQHCAPMKTTWCGQVAMSAKAASSKEWSDIKQGLDACDSSCSTCGGLLVAGCTNGLCRAPR